MWLRTKKFDALVAGISAVGSFKGRCFRLIIFPYELLTFYCLFYRRIIQNSDNKVCDGETIMKKTNILYLVGDINMQKKFSYVDLDQ